MIVTGIPEAPSTRDRASLLTLVSCGGGVERRVQEVESVQVRHVALRNMALQSKDDSHPLVESASLLNFPLVQAVMVMQVDALEQAAHVVSTAAVIALQLKDDSHPLVASASLLNLLREQVTAVHMSLSEHVSQVPLTTVGQGKSAHVLVDSVQ